MTDDWIERYHREKREEEDQKGGPGSGHYGHAGRPGQRGGSLPANVAVSIRTGRTAIERQAAAAASGREGPMTASQVRKQLLKMGKRREVELANLKDRRAELRDKVNAIRNERWNSGAVPNSPVHNRITAKLEAAQNEHDAANAQYKEAIERHLGEQRELLYVDNPAQFGVEEQSRLTGERRDAIRTGIAEARRMIGTGTVDNGTVYVKAGGRGRSRCGESTLYMTTWAREASTMHEMGHWLEHNDYDVYTKAKAFLDSRTEGQAVKSLRSLKPGYGFRWNEYAIPDRFSNPYMGKIYDHGATEIVSMGMEEMWSDPAKFAGSDPEYFDLIYDLLRGN